MPPDAQNLSNPVLKSSSDKHGYNMKLGRESGILVSHSSHQKSSNFREIRKIPPSFLVSLPIGRFLETSLPSPRSPCLRGKTFCPSCPKKRQWRCHQPRTGAIFVGTSRNRLHRGAGTEYGVQSKPRSTFRGGECFQRHHR